MSHFSVLVQTDEYVKGEYSTAIEIAMKNFCEDPEYVDPPFLGFLDITDEIIEEYNNLHFNDKKDHETVEDYAEYMGYEVERDAFGELHIGSLFTKEPKWDWFTVGGRWNNMLKTKSGEYVNCCKVKDLDLCIDEEKYDIYIKLWELYIEKDINELTEEEQNLVNKYFQLYSPEYYKERYKTKENYALCNSSLKTYAILTVEEEWLEPAPMGWFGISYANTEEEQDWDMNYINIIKRMDPESYVTIVDCHI